ncbi:CAP-associated domain-containing protein [Solibacillus sp. FSL W7-1436]|uniref:CAP domain-containing protein n=1 Tax=Solibacillus sp. FSL W7-1436 TaxID=2921705 RepID=UPI0030F78EDE
MKVLFRILIIATCIGIVVYYSNEETSQTELLEGPPSITKPVVEPEPAIPAEQYLPRPATGISTLIGKTSKEVLETYSTPKRIDPSEYGYEWWIYDTDNGLLMVSMKEDRVNQIYTNNSKFDIAPFIIGEPLDDIYRSTVLGQEITVELEDNIYIFAMNEQDLHNRILVKYENLYAQLYIDDETNQLYSVRFLDGETLVLHKPYEMQFIGELYEASTPSSYIQIDINLANRRQLTDLANSLRMQYGLPALLPSDTLASLADYNSEHMFLEMMDSQVTDDDYKIEDHLNEMQQSYERRGINVATNYKDAIEVIHGWMNSKEHRTLLTDEEFTHIGSGAFMNYYTQLYVKQK